MTHQRRRWRIGGGGPVDVRLLGGPYLVLLRRVGVPLLVAAQLGLTLCRRHLRAAIRHSGIELGLLGERRVALLGRGPRTLPHGACVNVSGRPPTGPLSGEKTLSSAEVRTAARASEPL